MKDSVVKRTSRLFRDDSAVSDVSSARSYIDNGIHHVGNINGGNGGPGVS